MSWPELFCEGLQLIVAPLLVDEPMEGLHRSSQLNVTSFVEILRHVFGVVNKVVAFSPRRLTHSFSYNERCSWFADLNREFN
jgi:hypothetical protein